MVPPCYSLPVLFFPNYLFYLFSTHPPRSYGELSHPVGRALRRIERLFWGWKESQRILRVFWDWRIMSIAEMSFFCLVRHLIMFFLDHLYEKRLSVGS